MTILLHPTEKCNFRCEYCFEPEEQRHVEIPMVSNFDAVERSLEMVYKDPMHAGGQVGIHGGEPTMASHTLLRRYFKLANSYNSANDHTNSIVTNGSLIDSKTIKLFKQYNVHVAISCDGPKELNVLRGPDPSNVAVTENYNKDLMKNIRELRNNKISVAIMCILHTKNAGTDDKVEQLIDWLDTLRLMGISGGRINQMESNYPWTDKYELSPDRLLTVYKRLFDWVVSDKGNRYLPMREFVDNLLGFGNSPCIFNKCDWYHTNTVSILPDGTISNCDRTFGEGLHVRAPTRSSVRQNVLALTDCNGCRYWTVCYGGCPSEAIDGDWRRKNKFCDTIYGLYEHAENKLRGLLPNIVLTIDQGYEDPFKRMSWAYVTRASSWGSYTPRTNVQAASPKTSPYGPLGQYLTAEEKSLAGLDPTLPWRHVKGGYYADEHTDSGGQQQ